MTKKIFITVGIYTCLIVLILLASVGCGLIDRKSYTVPQQWIRADRATFDLVAPTLRLLADNDPTNDPDLSGINGPAVLQLIESWEARLVAAETQLRWLEDGGAAFR